MPPVSIIDPFPHHVTALGVVAPLGEVAGVGASLGVAVGVGIGVGVGVGDGDGVGFPEGGADVPTVADGATDGRVDVAGTTLGEIFGVGEIVLACGAVIDVTGGDSVVPVPRGPGEFCNAFSARIPMPTVTTHPTVVNATIAWRRRRF